MGKDRNGCYPQIKMENGFFKASDEEWIARSQDAVEESMLADPDFNVLVEDGTLDQSESGVKGLIMFT